MTIRLDYLKHADPEPLTALSGLSGYLHESELDPALLLLIELRASQLNGCAYCVDMHTKDFEALGEERARGYLLSTWREANVYTKAERAALAWTEVLTKLHAAGDLQREYEELAKHFSAKQMVRITLAVVAINSWNRLSVAFGRDVGAYKPGDLTPIFSKSLQKLRS